MNILADSGFLYAYFEPREVENHRVAIESFNTHIDPGRASNKLLLLWPVLYETINTRFVKFHIDEFNRLLRFFESRNLLEYVDDKTYRDKCLSDVFNIPNRDRGLSLVDLVIIEALYDCDLRVDAIITFDPGAFSEICEERGLRLLCQEIAPN